MNKEIITSIAVLDENNTILEEFDNLKDAKEFCKENDIYISNIVYIAQLVIDSNGNTDIPFFGRTKKQAIEELKRYYK